MKDWGEQTVPSLFLSKHSVYVETFCSSRNILFTTNHPPALARLTTAMRATPWRRGVPLLFLALLLVSAGAQFFRGAGPVADRPGRRLVDFQPFEHVPAYVDDGPNDYDGASRSGTPTIIRTG